MEVNGQVHAPAAFLLVEEPPVPIIKEAGWASEQVWVLEVPEGKRSEAKPRYRWKDNIRELGLGYSLG
jgi:hypothetical protein